MTDYLPHAYAAFRSKHAEVAAPIELVAMTVDAVGPMTAMGWIGDALDSD